MTSPPTAGASPSNECTARADYRTKCVSCGATPTVVVTKNGRDVQHTELCGPCCFGEAACVNPEEWAS